MRRRIAFAIGSRANWGSSKSVIQACQDNELDVVVIAYATALLDRYGSVVDEISRVADVIRVSSHVEGGDPAQAVQSAGLAVGGMGNVFGRINPDVVYVVGDRYEVLAPAYAAQLLNIRVAHQMAGELTGTVDEPIRHAISKLAHMHFCATERSAARVLEMGEDPRHVHMTGCPRIDLCLDLQADPSARFVMVMMHPVTTELVDAGRQTDATLEAVHKAWKGPIHLWWPNSDPGCEAIVRRVREHHSTYQTHRSLPPEQFLSMLAGTACIVGNSSSAIREGSYLGTPAVNIGTRQSWRERGPNVIDTTHDVEQIATAIRQQLQHGPYDSCELYGDGYAGERIADVLSRGELPAQQKHWHERRISA